MTAREELHQLVDHIPEGDIPTTQKFLRSLVDPVELSLLNAALDDEPESRDERLAVNNARSENSPGTAHEELLREYGL